MITLGFVLLVMAASLAVGAATGALLMQTAAPPPRAYRTPPARGRHRARGG